MSPLSYIYASVSLQWVVTSKDHLLYLTCIVLAKAYIDENSQFFILNK